MGENQQQIYVATIDVQGAKADELVPKILVGAGYELATIGGVTTNDIHSEIHIVYI